MKIPPGMMRRFATALLVATLAGLASCNRRADIAAAPSPNASATLSQDEVERLRALGYVDVADEPADPSKLGVMVHDRVRSQPGYNLFTNALLCSTQIIDADGHVVHSWSHEPCYRWNNTVLLPDGDLLAIARDRAETTSNRMAEGRHLIRFRWDGTVVWDTQIAAHHDVQLTPRDQIAVLTFKHRLIPEVHPSAPVKEDYLTLLSPAGEVLEEASLYELLKAAPDQFKFQQVTAKTEEDRDDLDLLHSNSVDWMSFPELAARDPLYAPANVLICMRHQDTVAVVSWDRKQVIWAWGQGELSGPHDAEVLPNGHFLIFDNGLVRGWSRVIELDPLTHRIVWQYRAPDSSFYTRSRGANQRLVNGNTLIVASDAGRAFEIEPDGTIVWEFLNPNLSEGRRVVIVRMRRFASEFVEGLLSAGSRAPGASPGGAD